VLGSRNRPRPCSSRTNCIHRPKSSKSISEVDVAALSPSLSFQLKRTPCRRRRSPESHPHPAHEAVYVPQRARPRRVHWRLGRHPPAARARQAERHARESGRPSKGMSERIAARFLIGCPSSCLWFANSILSVLLSLSLIPRPSKIALHS
jgi:hypothetical protein